MEEKRSYSRQVSSASGVDSFVLAGEDHIKEQNQDLSGITGANLFFNDFLQVHFVCKTRELVDCTAQNSE